MTTEITRDFVKTFCTEADAALRALALKHGLKMKPGRTSYDASGFSLSASFVGSDLPVNKTREGIAFTMFAETEGLPVDILGKTFHALDGSGTRTVVGYNTRAPKMPILLKDAAGRGFKAPASYVKRMIAAGQVA